MRVYFAKIMEQSRNIDTNKKYLKIKSRRFTFEFSKAQEVNLFQDLFAKNGPMFGTLKNVIHFSLNYTSFSRIIAIGIFGDNSRKRNKIKHNIS